jgi:hypothetical protein
LGALQVPAVGVLRRTYSAVTDDPGFYALPNLSPGGYGLTVEFPGCAKYSQSGIVLRVRPAPSTSLSPSPPIGSGPLVPGSLPPKIPTNWQNAYLPSLTEDFNVHVRPAAPASRLTFRAALGLTG